ncbi:hypothetical protein RV09_GL002550 [Enterococcus moraviensis]|nr:hypothetical protein RV09_GL002550 [Enterococcus moraviensis]
MSTAFFFIYKDVLAVFKLTTLLFYHSYLLSVKQKKIFFCLLENLKNIQ